MKILITGATGFVGQTLIPQLQKQHSQVDILTLNRSVRKAEIMYPSDTYPCVKHTYADDWKQVNCLIRNWWYIWLPLIHQAMILK